MTKSFENMLNFLWSSTKRKIVSIIVLLVMLFIGVWQVYPRVACTINGGEWIRDGITDQAQYCLRSYSDAGKACKSSKDCEGTCILEGFYSSLQPVPTSGRCTPDNRQFGCFDYFEYPNVFSVCAD